MSVKNLGGIGEIGEMSSVFTDKKRADLKTYPVAKRLSRAIHRAGVSALQWSRMAFRLLDEVKMAASSRHFGPTAPWNATCPARCFARRTMSKKNEPSRKATEPGRLEIPLIGRER